MESGKRLQIYDEGSLFLVSLVSIVLKASDSMYTLVFVIGLKMFIDFHRLIDYRHRCIPRFYIENS